MKLEIREVADQLAFPRPPVFGTNPANCIAIGRLFTGRYPS